MNGIVTVLTALLIAVAVGGGPVAAEFVPRVCPPTAFSGLYPAIERRLDPNQFEPGQIVEFDPRTLSEAAGRDYVRGLRDRGIWASVYIVGGHCDLGQDCDRLKGVRLGPTGSWNWDRSERRILDITHPKVLARIEAWAEDGWRLGANFIRVDNLHYPAGTDRARTSAEMKVLIDRLHDLEDRLRAERAIPFDRPTGLVAHNNLGAWEDLLGASALRRPPVFLTSERTAQLAMPGRGYLGDTAMQAGQLSPADVPEIGSGRRIALRLGIPYTIVEFQRSHDLTRPDRMYDLPPKYVAELRGLSGVTEVLVLPTETHYVGRGIVHEGSGSRVLATLRRTDRRHARCVVSGSR